MTGGGPKRSRPAAAVLALLVAVVVTLIAGGAGCSPAEGKTAPPTPVPGEASAGTVRTPPKVTEDQQFSFDEIAQFPDGMEFEMDEPVASKAERTQHGAETTNGELVTVSIRISNFTEQPYDAAKVKVFATYGDGTPAPVVLDTVGELQSRFTGTVAPSDETVAPFGFAIPFAQLTKVTYVVDPGDGLHETVSFTGAVERQ